MDLPIMKSLEHTIETILTHPCTIITSPTGSGKSTIIPKTLFERGYRVVTTQSRILGARSLAYWVSHLTETVVGHEIGYNTGYGSLFHAGTRCLYRTDGTELLFACMNISPYDILIIDEVHEWNHNQELLIALAREQLQKNPAKRVVVMSATMHAHKVSKFMFNAPVLELEGHPFNIVDRVPRTTSIAQEAVLHAREGKNVLVFLPGKSQIQKTIAEISQLHPRAVILPLHSEQSSDEQALVFERYELPKIICATDIAQTTITIPDLDEVISSGIKRAVQTHDGVAGLYFERISRFEEIQQRGRAGRTKLGGFTSMYRGVQGQPEEPSPAIVSEPIDQQALLLAAYGRKVESVNYFHTPPVHLVRQAYDLLISLDALHEDMSITTIGQEMVQFSCKSEFARMLVEAHRLGVLPDVVKIVSALEVKGIHDESSTKWKKGVNNTSSDLIGQLELFNKALGFKNEKLLPDHGIHLQKWRRALELHDKLWKQLMMVYRIDEVQTHTCNKSHVVQACVTGLKASIYKASHGKAYGDSVVRIIGKFSTTAPRYSGWVAGIPFDLEIQTDKGIKTLHLLTMVTHVTDHLLAKIRATRHENIATYRYLPDQHLVLVTKGSKEIVTTWEDLVVMHTSREVARIRQQMIDEQFEQATEYQTGKLQRTCLGKASGMAGVIFEPAPYGIDPATQKTLYAFSACVQNPVTGKAYITFFKSEEEMHQALQRSLIPA